MTTPGHTPARTLHRSLAATAAAACCAAAQAQLPPPSPVPPPNTNTPAATQTWTAGVSQTLTYESNLFRLSEGDTSQGPREDWVSGTGLNLGLDQPLGRQRLRGQASLLNNRYREHGELNSTGHDLRLVLDWETVGNLSGDAGARAAQRQYRYGLDTVGVFDGGRNDETTQSAFFHARLGGMGLWALQVGAEALRRDYSADAFATQELSQRSVEGGVGWRPSPDLAGALLARQTRIDRPDVSLVGLPVVAGDDVTRNDIEATLGWQASGASRFEGRATRSQEEHSVFDDRGFWTGSLAWLWSPSAKLNLTTRLLRDTAGQSGKVLTADAQLPSVPASDQLRSAFEWTALWRATPKIQVSGTIQWSRRALGRAMVDGRELNDRTRALSFGLRYEAARWLDMGCDLRSEQRESNASAPDELRVTRPYDALAAGCTLSLWFR